MVISDTATEVLQTGLKGTPAITGKRRQRAYYYRRVTVQGGEMVWVRTELLPSDTEGRAYYTSKGFRLDPPEGTEWARKKPEVRDESRQALEKEVAELKAQLATRDELERELAKVKDQVNLLKARKGKKGRRKVNKEVVNELS